MIPTLLDYDTHGFSVAEIGSPKMRSVYDENGWILIKGFYSPDEVTSVRNYVNHLIDLKMRDLGLTSSGELEQGIKVTDYLTICDVNRAKAGEIYRACRNVLPLHQMACSEQTVRLTSFLMGAEFINSNPFTALRIDQKRETQYLFEWHQDYPYTQGSLDGVVIWGGLADLPPSHGGIKLISKSHKDGLRKLKVVDPDNVNKNGAHSLRIVGHDELDEEPSLRIATKAGDVLAFNTLLLHKSVPMNEGRVRWTYQIRHSNFDNGDAIQRGWPGGMALGDAFQKHHPEYVV